VLSAPLCKRPCGVGRSSPRLGTTTGGPRITAALLRKPARVNLKQGGSPASWLVEMFDKPDALPGDLPLGEATRLFVRESFEIPRVQ
jgi:hypothetical protein